MKKMILTIAIALSSLFVFAAEQNVNATVLNAFNKEFKGAQQVEWTATEDYYKANFVFNGQHVAAFYSTEGNMLAMTRNISSLDLPLSLQTNLRNDYSSYWISDLFEVSNADGTNYYITMEKADGKVMLKSNSGGKWSSYKKITKI